MSRGVGREHESTRRAIAVAACEVVADLGPTALSVRRVALAAGVSAGRVQHYYPDRLSLLLAAFDQIQAEVAEAVRARTEPEEEPRELVEAILTELIPVDAASAARLRVMSGFETLSLTEPLIARRLHEGHAALLELLEHLLCRCALAPGHAARDTAELLLALAEGLSWQVLLGHQASEPSLSLLRRTVETFLPADDSHSKN